MKNVLITGGAGFIGSHTCIEMLEKGFNICILDSLANSSIIIINQIEKIIRQNKKNNLGKLFFKKGDLRDISFIDSVFTEFKDKNISFDSVIHFAGLKSVEESVVNPLIYWEVNVISTINLLKIMNKHKCNNLVFSSSATIYDQTKKGNFIENSEKKPINPYGNTKLTIERLLSDLFKSDINKWKIVNLRYFNPVGAHYSGLIGENPISKPTNLFPLILKVASKEKKELSIYGNDWPTKDGTCVRDFVHVMDLAEAHLAALKFLLNNEPQIINLNIGTGEGTSVLELVNSFMNTNKCDLPYVFERRRPGDVPYSVADNTKALKLLDWKPSRSIEDICKDTWRWNKANIKNEN